MIFLDRCLKKCLTNRTLEYRLPADGHRAEPIEGNRSGASRHTLPTRQLLVLLLQRGDVEVGLPAGLRVGERRPGAAQVLQLAVDALPVRVGASHQFREDEKAAVDSVLSDIAAPANGLYQVMFDFKKMDWFTLFKTSY
jgi:hypothetical protein